MLEKWSTNFSNLQGESYEDICYIKALVGRHIRRTWLEEADAGNVLEWTEISYLHRGSPGFSDTLQDLADQIRSELQEM